MASRTLPDTPTLPLDRDRVVELIRHAIRALLRDLANVAVPMLATEVFRTGGEDVVWQTETLMVPNYRSDEVWDAVDHVWRSTEALALTDYLWEHGAWKRVLSSDDEQVPSRGAWERAAWSDVVFRPLISRILPQRALEQAVRAGTCSPWQVNDNDVEAEEQDVADALLEQPRLVTAVCPTIGLYLPEDDSLSLDSEVTLRRWSPLERCIFMTQNHERYLADDMSTSYGEAVVEIRTRVRELTEAAVATQIAALLDRTKWALQLASPSRAVFEEGPVILRYTNGSSPLRRGDTLMRTRALRTVPVSASTAQLASALLAELKETSSRTSEIDAALWHYGRACNAQVDRDTLLDATIGLEMLLVPNAGESRYRFGLHGAMLLAKELADPAGTLREIYDLRSKAAHGSAGDAKRLAVLAPRAAALLAAAIRSVINLDKQGELALKEEKGDIAKAVEKLVLSQILARARQ